MKNPKQLKKSEISSLRITLLQQQGGRCPICKKCITDPCLDHEHKKRLGGSGLIRGVVCRTCNSFIAKAENNCLRCKIELKQLPHVLRSIADYLEQPHKPFIHPKEAPKPKKLQKSSYNQLIRRMVIDGVGLKKGLPPKYPKSGKLTKTLEKLYEKVEIEPQFYK